MEDDPLVKLCRKLYEAGVESARRKGVKTQDLDDYALGFMIHMLIKI